MTFLFDFDGTLADSMPTFGSVMIRVLTECGIEPPEGIINTVTPLGYEGSADYFRGLGATESKEALVKRMHALARVDYESTVPLKATVKEALEKMKARGDSLNVLTASPHEMLDPCLKRCGVYELFDRVWSCEDFGKTKSNPEIYRDAAQALGTDVKDVIFVDDNPGAVDAAHRAGCKAIGIYDESASHLVDKMRSVADGYVYTLIELLELK